jgi:hypothetical protein
LTENSRSSAGVKALSSGFIDFWGKISYLAKIILGKKYLMSKKVEIGIFRKYWTPRGGLVQEVGYFARKIDKPTA